MKLTQENKQFLDTLFEENISKMSNTDFYAKYTKEIPAIHNKINKNERLTPKEQEIVKHDAEISKKLSKPVMIGGATLGGLGIGARIADSGTIGDIGQGVAILGGLGLGGGALLHHYSNRIIDGLDYSKKRKNNTY